MIYYDPIVYVVPPLDDGMTLRFVLHGRMGLSRKLLSRLKRSERGIMVNGRRLYVSEKVKAGDVVEVRMEAEQSDDILPQPLPFDIIFEDDHLLIVNKQAGMIVHPTHGHYTNTLANAVVHYWNEQGKRIRFRPVHRLDRDTSGVLIIAKHSHAHKLLSDQLQDGRFGKQYIAYVHGHLPSVYGVVEAPIDRDPAEPHVRIVTGEGQGYPAVTRYREMQRYGQAAKIQLELITGRTHQIRVHMKYIGCPLIGDDMYGIPREDEERHYGRAPTLRQALHASEVHFTHPMTGELVSCEAPLPDDLMRLESLLRERER